ncbi:hypothetical protein [Sporofaciens musculi]|nr:hypothetical protein [Sporofaciens musculi]
MNQSVYRKDNGCNASCQIEMKQNQECPVRRLPPGQFQHIFPY